MSHPLRNGDVAWEAAVNVSRLREKGFDFDPDTCQARGVVDSAPALGVELVAYIKLALPSHPRPACVRFRVKRAIALSERSMPAMGECLQGCRQAGKRAWATTPACTA